MSNSNCLVCTKYPVPKIYSKCACNTKEFVNQALEFIKNNPQLTDEEIFAKLAQYETSNQYYIIYGTAPSNKGVLLYHGSDGFVSQSDPCGTGKPPVGDNLWNYKSLNGLYAVRVFYKIATNKKNGGWFSYHWTSPQGKLAPKYVYIQNASERGFLVSSGFIVKC